MLNVKKTLTSVVLAATCLLATACGYTTHHTVVHHYPARHVVVHHVYHRPVHHVVVHHYHH